MLMQSAECRPGTCKAARPLLGFKAPGKPNTVLMVEQFLCFVTRGNVSTCSRSTCFYYVLLEEQCTQRFPHVVLYVGMMRHWQQLINRILNTHTHSFHCVD